MGKYKVLIIDDNNQRKSIYNKMFLDEAQDQNTFELFYASESFEEFLEKKDKEDYHLYVVDLTLVWNGTKENNLENTFRKVLQTIGNRKPIILLSAEFNNNANWINDECLKYNIIHIISWDKAKNDREVRSNLRTNIIFVLDKTYNYSKMTKLDNDPVRILHLSDLQFDCNDIIKKDFSAILSIIENARERAYQAVNRELIDMYWEVGKYVSEKGDKIESINEKPKSKIKQKKKKTAPAELAGDHNEDSENDADATASTDANKKMDKLEEVRKQDTTKAAPKKFTVKRRSSGDNENNRK